MSLFPISKRLFALSLASAFLAAGCVTEAPSTGRARIGQGTQTTGGTTIGGFTSGSTTSGTTSGTGDGIGSTSILPTVEIRHLIEPNFTTDPSYSSGTGYHGGGSYVRKLTLPKNYAGKLYLSGINISTLNNRVNKVRIKFGKERHSITLNAAVAKATGITPQNDISVLIMDLKNQPFYDTRLLYDLYDYNDYSNGQTPVQDNRNSNLYCRGLDLQDDPTFTGVGNCLPGQKCLYTHAKVVDQGLVEVGGAAIQPSRPQIKASSGGSYYADPDSEILMKPLPDAISAFQFNNTTSFVTVDPLTGVAYFNTAPVTLNQKIYKYEGPYQLVGQNYWSLNFTDLTQTYGLFRESAVVGGVTRYFKSNMFPLAYQRDIQPNIPYLGSDNWDDDREETNNSAGGLSKWMDGSSARAESRNNKGEHIGSCNVSSTIEIIAKDDSGNEYIVAETSDVKIQLVRETQYFEDINSDVLFTNFKRCSSNASCGSGECCYNNRCWDETLVSQCRESSVTQGNRLTGQSCGTDFDCVSLCCDSSRGVCAAHNTSMNPPALCSKPIGSVCIAKEWCQKVPVVKYLIVKLPNDPYTGAVRCALQSYTVLEYGDCKAGTCVPPYQEPIPSFDPNAPGACANAVVAPNF